LATAGAGRFITIEGIDGSGKTTQARMLVTWLGRAGYAALGTREPGGTEAGQTIRSLLLDPKYWRLAARAELLLYLADRAQHVDEVIRPALAEGKVVVCERFTDSTLAYQGYGRGLELDWLRQLNQYATGCLTPDLTLVLEITPESAAARKFGPSLAMGDTSLELADRLEREHLDFHRRVAQGYQELAAQNPDRIQLASAEASADQVQARLIELIAPILPARQVS